MITPAARVSLLLAALSIVAHPSSAAAACKAGSYSSNGQEPCTKCDPGTYQPNSGQTSCQQAQAGWYASGSGATSQSICQQGTYSKAGAASCTPCPAGSYCNGQGQTAPVLCPKGHYSPSPGLGQQCYECPKGMFVAVEGATACCSCCSGFYNDQTAQDHCFNCPVSGAYSPAGATSKDQCGSTSSGGLTTCTMTGNSCPNTCGTFPSGTLHWNKRRKRDCPQGHRSCATYGPRGFLQERECVDVRDDLERCGGCVAPGESLFGERTADGGRDCSAIPHVDSVTCSKGACVIGRCATGYVVSPDGEQCVLSLNVQGRYPTPSR
ncbi:hypothetical protein BD414DRAFT_449149 [Trametes punicea]|nr:hypothetical protein BD414DRAFT_449149 [Trametes punicea]